MFPTFSSGVTNPGQVSYEAISLSANLTLQWPSLSLNTGTVVALIMEVTPTVGSLAINMPPANQAGVGSAVLIRNLGGQAFTLQDNTGATIASVAAGVSKYCYLTNNSTVGGTWSVVTFGTGTSQVDASQLAGLGLLAIGATLNQNSVVIETSSNITIDSTYLSKTVVWTAGSLSCSLPSAGTMVSGFYTILKNGGNGSITVTPAGADTIDGAASLVLAPGDACLLADAGGSGHWYTIGLGRSVSFAFTQLVKNVAGNTDVTLTSADVANKVIQFTGALTGNINVIFPNTVGVFYVFNNTSGAFTLTCKTAAGSGFTVVQGTHDIIVDDATNVTRAITNTAATTAFSSGSASAPSITFIGNTNTGIFQPGVNQVGITANGLEVMQFETAAGAVNFWDVFPSATTLPVTLSALGTDASISLALKPKGIAGTVILQDNNGNAVVIAGPAVASAVNAITAANAATGNAPSLSATGTDPNIALNLTPKGNKNVVVTLNGLTLPNGAVGAPGLVFGDATTGFYRPAANQIGVAISGLSIGEFDSTGLNSMPIGQTTAASGAFTVLKGTTSTTTPIVDSGAASALSLKTNNGTTQVTINHTASATRQITLTGSNGGAPTISTTAGDLTIQPTAWTTFITNVASTTPGSLVQGLAIGWNVTSGAGEVDFYSNKGAGSTGGFAFYDWNGTTATQRFLLTSAGQFIFNGAGGAATGFGNAGDVTGNASTAIKSRSTYSAWALHDSTGAIVRSLNVGSITKNGTGDFTMNITSGVMADGSYGFNFSVGSNGPIICFQSAPTAPTATALRYVTEVSTTGAVTSPTGNIFAGVIP